MKPGVNSPYVSPLTMYETLLATSCIIPVHSRAESNYRVKALMKVKMCMKGKVWYYLGKSLPLDSVRRKEKHIVFWDDLYAGLEIEGSMMSLLKSFYSIPILYIKYTRVWEIRTTLPFDICYMPENFCEGMVGQLKSAKPQFLFK